MGKGEHIDRRRKLAFSIWTLAIIALIASASSAGWVEIFLPIIARDWIIEPEINSPLLISEVLYHPSGGEPDFEWIEIFNRGQTPIDLGAYKIGDSEVQGDVEGMYDFPQERFISPGQAVVIAYRGVNFTSMYGFEPDFEFIDTLPLILNMIKYRDWANGSLNLSNAGDEVVLLDPEDVVIDAVSWGISTYAFDPPVDDVPAGFSIERKPADQDHDQASNWQPQPSPAPGKVDLSLPTPYPT